MGRCAADPVGYAPGVEVLVKRWWLVPVVGVAAGVVTLGGSLAWLVSSMPVSQGERVFIREDLVGVDTGGSYAWVVRTASGAALVDTGIDPEAGAILAELDRAGLTAADVHTVLLTHAHADHTGGLGMFSHARLVHGPGEGPLLRGEAAPKATLPWLTSTLVMPGPTALPETIVETRDGATLRVDGEPVHVLHTPGHTGGSTSYVWGEVLFSGDALVGGGTGVQLLPAVINEDLVQNRQSIRAYGAFDFDWMADGHAGATSDAGRKVQEFLEGSGGS